MDGVTLLERLRRDSDVPVIMTGEQWDMPAVLRIVRLGILDFCTKPVDSQKLRTLVHQGLRQDAEIVEVRKRIAEARRKLAKLTARQRELLALFASGLSHKEIAATLDISPRTVEHHRAHLNSQLGTDRLADLVRLNLLSGGTQALCDVCPNAVAAAYARWSHGCREGVCGRRMEQTEAAMTTAAFQTSEQA